MWVGLVGASVFGYDCFIRDYSTEISTWFYFIFWNFVLQAIALTLDKDMVRRYLCDNSSNPLLLQGVCSTGLMDMLIGWISPELVAKQVSWNATNVLITNEIAGIGSPDASTSSTPD